MKSKGSLVGAIPLDWACTHIGEICDASGGFVQTGPFGSQLHASDYQKSGTPVVMPKNLGNNSIDPSDIARIGPGDVDRLEKHKLEAGDIIFPRRGDITRFAYVTEECAGWLCGTGCLRIHIGQEKVSTKYLSYYLAHPSVQEWIVGNAIGTTMLNLNTSIIRDLPILLPPLEEQKAIAAVLSAFDDKIELNRQMNATLEEMARALFKSWFVDFDPVRRNQEARLFRKSLASAQPYDHLFPDRLGVDGNGRGAPAGWQVSTIGKEVDAVGGGTPSTKNPDYWEGGTINFTTPKDFSNLQSPVLLETARCITEKGLKKISSGLLPVGTVLMSSRAPVGYLAINEVPVAINQGFIAMLCNKTLFNHYVLFWAMENMHLIEQRAGGTTFREISKQNFRPIAVVVPPKAVVEKFDTIVGPLYQKIVGIEKESRTLAELRDALLPRLMSGRMRIPIST